MKLELPLLPDPGCVRLVNELADRVHSVYFSLSSPLASDARVRLRQRDPLDWMPLLEKLPAKVRKYALLNGRFLLPEQYFDKGGLTALAGILADFHAANCLDGVVFADFYFLRALAQAAPREMARLEAVPSVNFLPDTGPKILGLLEKVQSLGYRLPGLVVPDRSLNRDLPRLSHLVEAVRRRHPEILISLLANEGCLYECPYKLGHDAHIALSNTGCVVEQTNRINRALGCRRDLEQEPWRILASPFIRPRDLCFYDGLADVIKLCGRNLSLQFWETMVRAYAGGGYKGNLLELMDASNWMAGGWDFPEKDLGDDFVEKTAHCQKDCRACGWCERHFNLLAREKSRPLSLL